MGDAGQKKVLASYQSEYVRRMAKMGIAAAGKTHKPINPNLAADDDSGAIIDRNTIRDNARGALFATWEHNERMAYTNLNDNEKRRILVANFFQDEKAYFESICVLVKIFLLRLQVMAQVGFGVIEQSHILDLFSNVDDVRDVSETIWRDLNSKIERWDHLSRANPAGIEEATNAIAQALASAASNLSVYSLYVSNYERAQKLLEILRDSIDKFRQFVTVQEICEGAELPILLGFPCIRYTQYLYAVEEIMATYGADKSKAAELNKARKALEQVISEINDRRNHIDARMGVAYIQEKLFKGDVYIANPTRYFIKSGPLKKMYNKTGFKLKDYQKYMFFLFSDCLMYAARPSATSDAYKFKHAIPVAGMIVSEAPDTNKMQFAFHISGTGGQKSVTVFAADQKEKTEWIEALREAAARAIQAGARGGDDLENIIVQGRKALSRFAMRVADNWIQVSTDTGVNYFYQLKTGVTSLSLEDGAQVSSQPPSLEAISEEHGILAASMKPKFCLQPDCGRKAVATLGDGRYCAVHAKDAEFDADEKDEDYGAVRDFDTIPPPPDQFIPASSSFGRSALPPIAPRAPVISSFGVQDDVPPPPRMNASAGRVAPAPTSIPSIPSAPTPPPAPPAPAVGAAPPAPMAPAIPVPPRMGGMPPPMAPRPPSISQAGGLQVGFGLPRTVRAPPVISSFGDDPLAPPMGMPRAPGRPMGGMVPSYAASPPPPPSEADDIPVAPPARRPGAPISFRSPPPAPPAEEDDVPPPPVVPMRSVRPVAPAISTAPVVIPRFGARQPVAPAVSDDDDAVTASPVIPARKISAGTRPPFAPISAAAPPPPPPPAVKAAPKWKKVMSEQYKQYYYWCEKTNEVTWVKPPDYDGED